MQRQIRREYYEKSFNFSFPHSFCCCCFFSIVCAHTFPYYARFFNLPQQPQFVCWKTMNRKHDKNEENEEGEEMIRLNKLMKRNVNACEMRVARASSKNGITATKSNGIQMNTFRSFYRFGCLRSRHMWWQYVLWGHARIRYYHILSGKTASRPLNCNDDMMTILYCIHYYYSEYSLLSFRQQKN